MKKEESYTTSPIPSQVKIITTYYCDICTKALGMTLYRKHCCDLCERHVHDNNRCGFQHPDDQGSDYPRTLCKICDSLWHELYIPMQEKHEALEEAMEQEIIKTSKAHETN